MKAKLAAFLLFFAVTVPAGTAIMTPTLAYAATCPNDTLFLIPAWYNGLQKSDCSSLIDIKDGPNELRDFVIKIALNIVRAAFVIAGYAALFFLIKGGYLYILAQGDPGHITAAKTTITNAIIGIIVCLLASAIVTAIAGLI